MTDSISINPESNLIHIKSTETVGIDDAIEWLKLLRSSDQRRENMHFLCEIDSIDTIVRPIDLETLLTLVSLSVDTFGSGYKVAVVSHQELGLKIIKTFQQYVATDNQPYSIQTFEDINEACLWLDRKPGSETGNESASISITG